MILCVFVLWSLVLNSNVLYAERQDFKLDDFEVESRKWTKPHSDVFSYSADPLTDNLPDVLDSTGAVHNEQLHAALRACQSRSSTLDQQVKNIDIQVQRFVKHLVRIYSQSKDSHEGIIFMKITSDDMKVLKLFADDGIFSSPTHNNIHDLLRVTFTLPAQSMLEKLLPAINIFVRIPMALWELAMNVFQEIRLLLMEIVFSPEIVIYASMFFPPIVLSLFIWRGSSMRTAFFGTASMVAVIAYFVELRNSFEVARAKDMAKIVRSKNAPPQCTGGSIGYWDYLVSFFSSVDQCEQYFVGQVREPTMDVSEVFWKTIFTPLTVAMDKFGYGLRQFMSTFGKDLGVFSWFLVIPFALIALLFFLILVGAFLSGGSIWIPYFGKVSFGSSGSENREPAPADVPPAQPLGNTAPPAAITNIVHYHLFNSSHPASQITVPPKVNLAISTPNGPTLQLTSSPSPDNDTLGSSLNPSGQSISNVVREIRTLSHRSISSPAGPLGQQQLTSTTLPETNQRALVQALPETNSERGFESNRPMNNHRALIEVGSGDFVARDLSRRMPPSEMQPQRHFRKHSL